MSRTILLTGASGGIGRKCIEPLLKAGYRLALHYHENIEDLARELERIAPKQHIPCFKADLTREEDVIELFEAMRDSIGLPDILINNAGTSSSGVSWKLSFEEWNRTVSTNLNSVFLTTKHALPAMREKKWGRIVNISSVVAQLGMPGTSARLYGNRDD